MSVTMDFVDNEGSSKKEVKKLFGGSKKESVRKKNIHMILKGEDILRLESLRERMDPPTQTEVVINSLQLIDEIIREYDAGSTFYIKRKGDKEPIQYDIFS